MGTDTQRALIAVTSYNGVFYDDGKRTGLYWSEALHPYDVFRAAGMEVDVASETGTMGYDEHSIEGAGLDPESKAAWEDANNPLKAALKNNLLKASEVDPSKYRVFFAAGGHGAIFDYPKDTALQGLASKIYGAGGVLGAVCHGPAILPGVKDPATGQPLIKGRDVTGFTRQGEVDVGVMDAMRRDGVETIEQMVTAVGGRYVEVRRPMLGVAKEGEGRGRHSVVDQRAMNGNPPCLLGRMRAQRSRPHADSPPQPPSQPPGGPFDDFSIIDGRIASGVNPASAKSTAERVVKALSGA